MLSLFPEPLPGFFCLLWDWCHAPAGTQLARRCVWWFLLFVSTSTHFHVLGTLGWANNTVNPQSLLPSMATLDTAGILGLQCPYLLTLSLACGLVTSFHMTTFLLWSFFTTAIALLICLGSWHSCSQFSSDKNSVYFMVHFTSLFLIFSIVSLHEFSCSRATTHLLMKWALRSPIFRLKNSLHGSTPRSLFTCSLSAWPRQTLLIYVIPSQWRFLCFSGSQPTQFSSCCKQGW